MTVLNPAFKIVTTWQRKNGIERDAVQNTWHYNGPSSAPTSPDMGGWANNYHAFLVAIAGYIAPCMSESPNSIKVQYWRLPPEKAALGVPIGELFLSPPVLPALQGMPAEVSVVLTMKSYLGSTVPEHGVGDTRPASSRRNRVFIGPLATITMVNEPTTKEVGVLDTFRTNVLNAYEANMSTAQKQINWAPVTFSRATWSTSQTAEVYIDNAFDTQRRRGNDPTARTTKVLA